MFAWSSLFVLLQIPSQPTFLSSFLALVARTHRPGHNWNAELAILKMDALEDWCVLIPSATDVFLTFTAALYRTKTSEASTLRRTSGTSPRSLPRRVRRRLTNTQRHPLLQSTHHRVSCLLALPYPTKARRSTPARIFHRTRTISRRARPRRKMTRARA